MTVRKKMVMAYIAALIFFVIAIKLVTALGAIKLFYVLAAVTAVAGVLAYAATLKCPHCQGRPFSIALVPLLYLPPSCATCDRDLFLD